MSEVESRLARLAEFERKVRTIANLPGQAAAGGEDVEKVGGGEGGDLEADLQGAGSLDDEELVGEPATGDPVPRPRAGGEPAAASAPGGDRVSLLRLEAERLGHVAAGQELSLGELIAQLEDKHHHLVSSPAIWPTKGWLTSRFGPRISPFTGLRQFHSGIDIAGEQGTPRDRAGARPCQLRRQQGAPGPRARDRPRLRRANASTGTTARSACGSARRSSAVR